MARNIIVTRRDWMQDAAASFVDGVGFWAQPLTNMLDSRPQLVAEATTNRDWASPQFQVDLGYTRKVGLIWLANLRTSPMGIMEVKAGSDSGFDYNEYETLTTTWPPDSSAPFDYNAWDEFSLTHVSMRDEYEKQGFPRFFIPPAPIDCRYISVEIRDSTASEPIKIGGFGACEVWEPPINFDYGWSITPVDESDVTRVPGGASYVDQRSMRRRLSLGFSFLDEAEVLARSLGVSLIKGRSQPLVVIPFPDDIYNLEKTGLYGMVSRDSELSNPLITTSGRLWTHLFQIEQLV